VPPGDAQQQYRLSRRSGRASPGRRPRRPRRHRRERRPGSLPSFGRRSTPKTRSGHRVITDQKPVQACADQNTGCRKRQNSHIAWQSSSRPRLRWFGKRAGSCEAHVESRGQAWVRAATRARRSSGSGTNVRKQHHPCVSLWPQRLSKQKEDAANNRHEEQRGDQICKCLAKPHDSPICASKHPAKPDQLFPKRWTCNGLLAASDHESLFSHRGVAGINWGDRAGHCDD
jgi:hypothetical protein